jgi:hypothetical protein
MTIRKLTTKDFDKVMSFITEHSKGTPAGFFVSTDPKVIETCLHEEYGISHGAFTDGILYATRLSYRPGDQFAHYNADFDEKTLFGSEMFPHIWRVYGAIVEPSKRAQGIGAKLREENTSTIHSKDPKACIVTTSHVNNLHTISPLVRIGWKKKCSIIASDLEPIGIYYLQKE